MAQGVMTDLKMALEAALEAGKSILEIYQRDFKIEYKDDRSPLTEADQAAHHVICAALEPTGLPVLSEESRTVPYEIRKDWECFWLVDPLDGTKEFIKRNGEFTVNIALIKKNRSVLGVVYAPVLDVIYYGVAQPGEGIGKGGWKACGCRGKTVDELMASSTSLPDADRAPRGSALRIVASRSHCNAETEQFIESVEKEFGPAERVSSGSSLKLCRVAEGRADIYPRIAPTMEWDTAAAQAVVEASGGRVVRYDPAIPAFGYLQRNAEISTSEPLRPLLCNKENLLNPSFVVFGTEYCFQERL